MLSSANVFVSLLQIQSEIAKENTVYCGEGGVNLPWVLVFLDNLAILERPVYPERQ